MLIKPPNIEQLKCPFCENGLEFHLNESMSDKGIVFFCLSCKKKLYITTIAKDLVVNNEK